jgi:amylosucrase
MIAAPSVVLKAEAIERLDDVKSYFGQQLTEPECQLAYNNGSMTALWASLALGAAEPARRLLEAAARKPVWGTWVNYVRCHDDIIWSALTPYLSAEEQSRCSAFFAGHTSGSFSAGATFQAVAGAPPSTNGMASALVGITDDDPDSPGARRLLLLYGVSFALDGFPVVWMGDEIALGDGSTDGAEARALKDGRWLQRPFMDWARADRREDLGTLPCRVFQQLAGYGRLRADHAAFHARNVARPTTSNDPAILSFVRGEGAVAIQCLANFSDRPRTATLALHGGGWRDLLSEDAGRTLAVDLGPYQVRWLAAAP